MTVLTAELRELIRQARDAAVRREQKLFHKCCAGCGTEYGNWSLGCKTCYHRHRRMRDLGRGTGGQHPYGETWYKETLAAHQQLTMPRNGGQRARSV